jgi:regulator of sigma E protease
MLDLLRTVFAIVLVFGLVIFVHEFGHFIAAKAMGVYAPRFSIGFGPALWSRKWGETEYVLAAIPLGGYVRMASRDDETLAGIEGGNEQPAPTPEEAAAGSALPRWYDPNALAPFGPKPVPEHRWFESKSLPARLLIMVAGVTMNMVLGFLVLTGLTLVEGQAIIRTRAVGGVHELPGAPQLAQGIAVGDTIVAVNGVRVGSWNDVLAQIDTGAGDRITIQTQRNQVAVPLAARGDSAGVTRAAVAYAIEPYLPPVVDDVMPDSPADAAGLERGDSIAAVNGEPVATWTQLVDRIEASPGKRLSFTVIRKGTRHELSVRPDSASQPDPVTGEDEIVGKIGAQRRVVEERVPISTGRAVTVGWNETWAIAGSVVDAVHDLVTGRVSLRKLNGPIAIGRASASAARRGWDSLLYLIAILSINVAVFNLLPIPILDGGQIVVNVVESVKGSALSLRTREYLLRFGLAAIALLFVIVMYNDITNWVKNLFRL